MMRFDTYACLAAGGQSPRVDGLCLETRVTVPLVVMPAGCSSVYRGVVGRGGRSVIVGTKSGLLQHYSLDVTAPTVEHSVVRGPSVREGAPLLALAAINDETLAVSSLSGSLTFLSSRNLQVVAKPRVTGPAICGLAAVNTETLASLDQDGRVEVWAVPQGACLRYTNAPPPPVRWGSVWLHYWEQHGVLVYPGKGGRLVILEVGTGVIKSVQAHSADFYGICLSDGMLTTFGHFDGLCRSWTHSLATARPDLACPKGVVCAALLDRDGQEVVLVLEDGSALCVGKAEDRTVEILRLPGSGYRAAWGPDFDAVEAAVRQRRADGVREAAYQIADQLDAGNSTGHESLLTKLRDDGPLPLFHALSAKSAEAQGNLVAALAQYRELRLQMPHPLPHAAAAPMLRFADLLIRNWQHRAALDIYEAVLEAQPDHSCRATADHTRSLTQAMTDRPCLVEADMPIPDLVACADASGIAFAGRWVVKRLDVLRCPGLELTSRLLDEVRTRIERSGTCSGWDIRSSDIAALNRVGLGSARAIVSDQGSPSHVSLSHVARLVTMNRDLFVRPCVALLVQAPDGTHPIAAHNRAVLAEWKRIDQGEDSWRDVMSVHEGVIAAIRMLLTANVAEGMAIGGGSR